LNIHLTGTYLEHIHLTEDIGGVMRRRGFLPSYLTHLLTSVAFSIAALVLLPLPSQAQTPTIDQGTNPYSILHGGDIDSVSLANGNLLLHIPLISYPQRGDLHLGFFIAYDNHSLAKTVVPAGGHNNTYYFIRGIGVHIQEDLPWANSVIEAEQNNYEAMTPDGASHPLASTSDGLISMDATGFNYNVSSTILIDRNGTRITGGLGGFGSPSRIEDRNGNLIAFGTTNITDSVSRTIPIPPGSSGASTAPCPNPSTLPGALAPSAASLWNLPGPSGSGGSPMTICYAEVPITYDPCGGQLYCYGANGELFPLIQSIVLPNGTSWTFLYDSYGDVVKIAFPMGGAISYTWNTSSYCLTFSGCPVVVASRSVTDNTGTHTWTYSGNTGPIVNHTEVVTIMDPDQNQTIHTFSDLGVGGANPALYETSAEYYQNISGTQTPLKTVTTAFSSSLGSFAGSTIAFNVVPTSVTTTWPNNQVSKVTKSYDSGVGGYLLGQVIQEQDYDYGTGSPGSLLRTTINSYLAPGNSSYLANNLLDLRSSVQINNGAGTKVAYTTYGYDSGTLASSGITTQRDTSPPDGTLRGNQTSVAAWLNTGYLTTSKSFFDTGEVNIVTDPNLNKTTYAYSSTYAGSLPTTITNALNQITTKGYDLNTGLLTSTKDPNNQTTSFTYDNMWRLASVTYPDLGSATITHQETSFPFTATLTKTITSSLNYVSTNVFDGLGRISESELTSDTPSTTYTAIVYDALGRKGTVYNPTRCSPPTTNCGSESTWGYTTYGYDAISRVTQVTQPDASLIQTSYTGNSTTVTDEAGKKRTSVTDGLGRLTKVFEDPSNLNYETDYTYDALDDLTSVVQSGSRNRSFVYDSVKHLTSASNPESGAVTYTYDGDGNVLKKKDARSITTTYSYDQLNRLLSKAYTDGTATVNYTYDGNTPTACSTGISSYGLAIGRRTAMCDAALGVESWVYNDIKNVGWQITDKRTTNSVTESTVSQNNLAGSIASLTDPSLRMITYTYNGAGLPISAIDAANTINYATSAAYAPQGALAYVQNGAELYSTYIYNNRLQPCWMYTTTIGANSPPWQTTPCTGSATTGNILDLKYNFNLGTSDNGNVIGITNNRAPNRSQGFTYDNLNRITTAKTIATYSTDPTDCWGESYFYDNLATSGGAWGNLTSIGVASSSYNGCTQESLSQIVPTNNNYIVGFCYDASGNLLAEAGCPGTTYSYNAENQLTSTAGVNYTYDGDGKRVEKNNGTLYWYGGGSDPVAESNLTGSNMDEYIFFGGKRIAHYKSTGEIDYYAADHLGTSRVVVNSTGTILDDSDFYPFGGERPAIPPTSGNTFKFTGKERDAESNLDSFGARYNASSLGRFMSPDTLIPVNLKKDRFQMWISNPQHWNKYAYALNNPLLYIDPSGLTETIYYFLNKNLTDEQKKFFEEHKDQILNSIADKLKQAGIKDVVFKDGSTLSNSQVASMLTSRPEGVAFLNFVNKSYGGTTAGSGLYGGTGDNSRSVVFVGNLQEGKPTAAELSFRIAEVASHELGHGMGFYSRGEIMSYIEFWNKDLMNEGQGMPSSASPRQFDMSIPQNRQAVDEINKLPEYQPPQ
jgi:RHS repeat-associated protein